MVLGLGICDMGSSLWYLMQLQALRIPCTNFFAFCGFVFEPSSVVLVTCITASMLVLLRKSLVLQTRHQMQKTLYTHWIASMAVSWLVPLAPGIVFWMHDHLGRDQIYCWLKDPALDGSASVEERVYLYYVPIIVLLGVNLILMAAVAYTNWKLKMGLTKLALLWIPCSLLAVWVFPTISTIWSIFSSEIPFPLLFLSALLLPAQGAFNAVLFIILLGRARKRLEHTVSKLGESFDFAIDEVRVSLFGESITWYFNDDWHGT